MPNIEKISELERQAEHLYCIMAAAEPWGKAYSLDPETHAAIIKHEAKLERALRAYMRGLVDRMPRYINWDTYRTKTLKAFDVSVIVNDDQFDDEDGILLTLVTDITAEGIAIGAQAGEAIYNTPLGFDTYRESVQKTARQYSSKLVTQINATTRDYIQKSLEQSIKLGETTDQAQARIAKRIGSYSRAGTIARTESVTSYQGGMLLFGQKSGAVGKEWQAIQGACQICGPVDGKMVPINSNYSADLGLNPPGHPNCRCGQRLIYQNELDDNPKLLDLG